VDHPLASLFRDVVDLSPVERARYFDTHAIAPEARQDIESLIQFDTVGLGPLTESVAAAAARLLSDDGAIAEGGRCGPYVLVRVLGRGGMGTVFLAQRTDGEVEQRVAIKFVPATSMSAAFRERFLRERQILASLQHPGIAHLLDAGRTAGGHPYLVMEFVDGTPIDRYAESLPIRQRLHLFLRVCDAVAYAHRNLVIHRDIKPSNILVDASAQPRLLDFGIARMLDDAGDPGVTKERLLTPEYASPEQVRGAAHSTATDIYSLGAVLYRLLTGKSPHVTTENSHAPIETIVCSIDPVAPSRVNPALARDIDFVVLKALRKEPEERYPSVDAFADDIRAFLASRPVRARSASAWYWVRKFARRQWLPVSAVATVIASLSVGVYVANKERRLAERRFSDVRQLSNKLFDIDQQASEFAGSTKTRQLIVDTAQQYLQRLMADAKDDPALAVELANAYMKVAHVQGVPTGRNLGQLAQAGESLRIADELIRPALKRQPSNREAMFVAAEVAHDRMVLASQKGGRRDLTRRAEVLAFSRTAEEWLRKFHPMAADGEKLESALGLYSNIADQLLQARQLDDALRVCQQASEIGRQLNTRTTQVGMFPFVEAQVYQQRGDLDSAIRAIRDAVKLVDPGENTGTTEIQLLAHVLIFQGRILDQPDAINAGRRDEAMAALKHAFRITDTLVHADASDEATRSRLEMAGVALGDILRESDAARALDVYEHTLRHLREVTANNSVIRRQEVDVLVGSTYSLRALGRVAEARTRLDTAFAHLHELKLYPADKVSLGSLTYKALRARAGFEAATGNLAVAIDIDRRLLEQVQAAQMEPQTSLEDATDLSNLYRELADFLHRHHDAVAAETANARRRELWQSWDRKLPGNDFVHRQLVAATAN
jgi:serine/threonine protein kinase